jgi:hypothetical protein
VSARRVAGATQAVVNAQTDINRASFEVNKQFRRDAAGPSEDVVRVHLQNALENICEALQFLTPSEHKRAAHGKQPSRRRV